MLNIERAITEKYPAFATQPALFRRPTLALLRSLLHEEEINEFMLRYGQLRGIEFIDEVFRYFSFSYTVSEREKALIPRQGRVVIIANHPIGSLDGLALLRLVSEVRPDVRALANDMLMHFSSLHELLIPLDNMGSRSAHAAYKRVVSALKNEEAVIVFPAGEVSRARPAGVRDTTWRPGFLHFARRAKAPLLPVFIHARNSLFFYSASALNKQLGTALLAKEMFNKRHQQIRFSVGEPVPAASLNAPDIQDRTLVKRLQRHVYKLGRDSRKVFERQRRIADPIPAARLQKELNRLEPIGRTSDGNAIFLLNWQDFPETMKELGRQRELAFRAVGEGTGKRRDLDDYDRHYQHLLLWNEQKSEIAGAYRLAEGAAVLARFGQKGLYTRSLYRYTEEMDDFLQQGVELGRSFVAPAYQGRHCLDYLWQGLGAYLSTRPQLRYLLGPISMSADYPKAMRDLLVFYFQHYYASPLLLARAHHPYLLSADTLLDLQNQFEGLEAEAGFRYMQQCFADAGYRLPVLFRQYTSLFEKGGFQSLVFSHDPDFGDCLDGLCMADLSRLLPAKRKRYMPG